MSLGPSSELIEYVASIFGFESVVIQGHAGGFSARNFFIVADGSDFVLKRFRADLNTVTRIEHVTDFLFQQGLPVVKARRIGDVHHFGFQDFWYALFPKVPGSVLHESDLSNSHYESSADILRRIHSLPAPRNIRLHTSLQRKIDPQRALARLDEMLESIRSVNHSDEIRKLIELKRSLLSEKINAPASFLESQDLIHGDFHNENLIFGPDNSVNCILDFEHTRLGNRIEDVVTFINLACCNTGYTVSNVQKSRVFLEAYRSRNRLERKDLYHGFCNFVADLSGSVFLENLALEDRKFQPMITRDLQRLTFLKEHMRDFVELIAT